MENCKIWPFYLTGFGLALVEGFGMYQKRTTFWGGQRHSLRNNAKWKVCLFYLFAISATYRYTMKDCHEEAHVPERKWITIKAQIHRFLSSLSTLRHLFSVSTYNVSRFACFHDTRWRSRHVSKTAESHFVGRSRKKRCFNFFS